MALFVDMRNDPLLKNVPEVKGYKVLRPVVVFAKIGQGGMGAVYRGKHLNLDIEVAVKCLKSSLADENAAFIVRFQREAKLAAGIQHENLVRVYDVASEGGVHYLVMEYVAGESARERVKRKGPLDEREAATLLLGAARGLAAAHRKGIVHRDVKPDNILISREGVVKVADLGIARSLDSQDLATLTHGALGTPQYAPPEQWSDASKVGPTADVWALGATLYYLLAGENAIRAANLGECARRICSQDFPDVRGARPDVAPELLRILQRCTQREPERRFHDAAEVARELASWLGEKSTSLEDAEAGQGPAAGAALSHALVSPPPAGTLAEIRIELETRGGGAPAPEPLGATVTLRGEKIAAPRTRKSRARSWVTVAGAVLIGCAGFVGWRATRDGDGARRTSRDPLDSQPLVRLDVPLPADRTLVTRELSAWLRGQIENPRDGRLQIEYGVRKSVAELDADGAFALVFELEPDQRVPVRLTHAGAEAFAFELVQDSHTPELELLEPAPEARRTAARAIDVAVTLVERNPEQVRVGGQALAKQGGQRWRGSVALPHEGANRLALVATDRAANQAMLELVVVRDSIGPRLVELTPPEGSELVAGSRVELEMIFDEAVASLGLAGEYSSPASWSVHAWVDVPAGETSFTLLLETLDDLQNLEERELTYNGRAQE